LRLLENSKKQLVKLLNKKTDCMKKISLLLVPCTFCFAVLSLPKYAFSQNVGIGTTTPAFKLDVKNGSINTDSVYRIGGSRVLSANLQNTFVGIGAANSITTGNFNTAAGFESLYSNTTGERNTAFGLWSLRSNTSGSYNTAIGKSALHVNSTGSFNTANGYEALYDNTTGGINTAVGSSALSKNTIGERNTAFGSSALYSNTTASYNTAVGTLSLANNTASENTAVGYYALAFNTTGQPNTAIGTYSLNNNTTGSSNTANGYKALYANINGNNNTAIGYKALTNTTSGFENTAIGSAAGETYNNSSGNVFVGYNADVTAPGLITVIAVGYRTIVTASSTARFGNPSTTSYGGYAGWTNVSDGRYKKNVKENVPGLAFINKLRPVTYNLDATRLDAFYHKNDKKRDSLNTAATVFFQTALQEKEKITYTGFIAQEVEATAKAMGFDFSGVDAAKNENDTYGLRYAEFVVPLVKAVQEQQQTIDALSKELLLEKKQNEELLRRIEKLESLFNSKIK
jgi:trimeric autotransporter adhesin